MAARTNAAFLRLEEVAKILQDLQEQGEDVRIVGTTIMTKSGRVGYAGLTRKWVTHQYPMRPRKTAQPRTRRAQTLQEGEERDTEQ